MKKLMKAFVIGFSQVIPGVCSATVSIIIHGFNDFLYATSNLFNFKILKNNLLYFFFLFLGLFCGFFSLNFLFKRIPLFLSLVFLGVVVKNFPLNMTKNPLFKNIKHFILGFFIVVIFNLVFGEGLFLSSFKISFKSMFFLAILVSLSSLALVLPGISGSLLLLSFGLYLPLIENLFMILNIIFKKVPFSLVPFLVILVSASSFLVTLVATSKILYKIKTTPKLNDFINGMVLGSIINLICYIFTLEFFFLEFLFGLFFFLMLFLLPKQSFS